MQDLALDDPRIEVVGALGTAPGFHGGIVYHRLPDDVWYQLPAEVAQVASMPSGVRLRFATDAPLLGVRCHPIVVQYADGDPFPAAVDVVVGGRVVDTSATINGSRAVLDRSDRTNVEFFPGDNVTLTVSTGLSGLDVVELWLPQASVTEFFALRLPDGARIEPAPPDDRRRWVHHGSSISHAMEAHGPAQTWPAVAAAAAGVHVTNLGLAGQAQLDQFTARTIRDLPADLISLKLGINVVNADSVRERVFAPAVHGVLDTIRDGHPDVPIVLVSPIWCPAHETTPGPSFRDGSVVVGIDDARSREAGALTLERIRDIEEALVEARRANGDDHLHLLDGRRLFGPDDAALLPDRLHPDGDGQRLMGQRFADWAFSATGPFA